MLNRRGVSQIIAAMLMISITVAGAIVVYAYSSGLLGSLQGAKPQQSYLSQIALEYYNWNMVSGVLNLTIRNVGPTMVDLSPTKADFFVGGATVRSTGCGQLNPLQSCTAKLTNGSGNTAITGATVGVAYVVKLVAADGASFSYMCIPGRNTGSIG
jgi:archaellum component FlaF (FlaF/FlaG flagellin family)